MKTTLTLLTAIALLIVSPTFAQELPKTGAVLRPASNELTLTPGQTTEMEVTLVRSKVDRKTQFDAPQVQEIEGIHASIKATDVPDTYTLTPTTASGEFLMIVKGSGINKRYVTSSMVKLVVSQEALALEN